MRLEGFVSLDAPYGGGRFTTPPLRFSFFAVRPSIAPAHGSAQPITSKPSRADQHRTAHRLVEDDHRVGVALPSTVALSSKAGKFPRMGDSFDQGDRMEQNFARARESDVPARLLDVLRRPDHETSRP